jgi:hypothetical protein
LAEEEFEPLTNQLGVPGTSYKIQLGLINDQWASRLVKGNNILASKVYDLDEGQTTPNINYIVGWVLQTSAIPNINPHQVMKSAQALMNQAKQKLEKREIKSISSKPQEKSETKDIMSEEEKRRIFQERVKIRKKEDLEKATSKRPLPTIPSAKPEEQDKTSQAQAKSSPSEKPSKFCPYCGRDLEFKYCPYCGKKL